MYMNITGKKRSRLQRGSDSENEGGDGKEGEGGKEEAAADDTEVSDTRDKQQKKAEAASSFLYCCFFFFAAAAAADNIEVICCAACVLHACALVLAHTHLRIAPPPSTLSRVVFACAVTVDGTSQLVQCSRGV